MPWFPFLCPFPFSPFPPFFTIGSREELDSAYERFQHILSMLELYDAKVSQEDANLKFLRSLPSVWHVVATMIRGQPGLDELEFDDLYNNLKVYEHELKGVSNSSSQNIAFLSTEVKGSTLKQSTADPANIPKGYTQAPSSKVQTAPNCAFHSDENCILILIQGTQDQFGTISIGDIFYDGTVTEVEQDDWSMEFDAEHVHFGQDGLGDFDWSNKADDTPVSLALMATNSEVPYCSKCSKSYKQLLANYQTERDNFQKARSEILGYQMSLESLEVILKHIENMNMHGVIRFGVESSSSMGKWKIHLGNTKIRLIFVSNFQKAKDFIQYLHYRLGDSDDEETVLNSSEIQKKTVLNSKNSETSFENSPNHLIKDCNLHERTFKQTQTHKPKGTQSSRDTRPVWNNIQRVNHSNFSGNSRYPHQRRSFIPSAVLTREGLKSTARPKTTQTVPSKSTANVFYRGTARSRVPQAVLSRSTGRPYYPRMDNIRPRTSSFSPSSRSSTHGLPHRPQRPMKIMKFIGLRKQGNPEEDLKDYAIIDSGCSGSMTGDKDKLSDFKEFKGGYVAFGNDSKGGRISGKGTIKTSCLDFEKVSYVEELKFNLLSVSQICDKKHNVLFTDKECLILSPKFKFVDEDLETKDEAVDGTDDWGKSTSRILQLFKAIWASCKKIEERTVREPLELLHMDLFGPVSVESVNRKKYCLVVTDDCSKFSWCFSWHTRDETYDM
ncbi:ribonuclease H-like domain-containing protein [Tanacetum coccineum]|uniref:Ribonuclease H-like domain-containing protein n=1 Tax=Tanacetum coccineum TaxID=301880 RepID=A0ABQ5IJB2_9ASTR